MNNDIMNRVVRLQSLLNNVKEEFDKVRSCLVCGNETHGLRFCSAACEEQYEEANRAWTDWDAGHEYK